MQNRVDPEGNIIETKARGAWLGNRGQLHGRGKTILRPFKNHAWITCVLQFKGIRRQIMSPGLWTELFFLDEATAFAAGHRPCFECRRDDASRFKAAWLKGNPQYGFHQKTSIKEIDNILHTERTDRMGRKVTFEADAPKLPNGTFIRMDGEPWLIAHGLIHCWSPQGYSPGRPIPAGTVTVLTPRSIVNAFIAGYTPQVGVVINE